jgi:hypothetical protein
MGASKLAVSIKERLFLKFILDGMTQKAAYLKINPNKEITDTACEIGGWKYMRRLKNRIPYDKILDEWNLGLERIAKKIDELLEATQPRFHQENLLGSWPDNAARSRALELLVDMHKMKSQKLELTGKDGGPLEVLSTLNDIIKFSESHKPDRPEVSE